MQKSLAALALSVAACFLTPTAHANVTYTFVATSTVGKQVNYGGFLNDGTGFTGFPLSLTFTDAAVAGGSVSGSLQADLFGPVQQVGLQGFVSLTTYMDGATPAALYNALSLAVTFANGQIVADTLNFSGSELTIQIAGNRASLGSDGLLSCAAVVESGACTATGSFVRAAATAMPEPATAALLGAPLLALAVRRRLRI